MRYIIIFTITLILSLFIIYYNPYLGVYNNQMTIEYNFNIDNYKWEYEISNDCINIQTINDNKWIINPNKNGKVDLTFYYKNADSIKYKIYYELKVKDRKIYWVSGYGDGLLTYPNPY